MKNAGRGPRAVRLGQVTVLTQDGAMFEPSCALRQLGRGTLR